MAFSTAGSGPLRAEINITPMIDILLVLIIVFMVVVVSAFRSKRLDTQIPQPATTADKSVGPRTIVIQLAWAGDGQRPTLKINGEPALWGNLSDQLVQIFLQRAERVAFVKADDGVDFRYVAEAVSSAKSATARKAKKRTY